MTFECWGNTKVTDSEVMCDEVAFRVGMKVAVSVVAFVIVSCPLDLH